MTKGELTKSVAAQCGATQTSVKKILDAVLGTIGREVSKGAEVIVPDFGKFYTIEKPAREVRIPNGRVVETAAKTFVRFKAYTNIRYYSDKYCQR